MNVPSLRRNSPPPLVPIHTVPDGSSQSARMVPLSEPLAAPVAGEGAVLQTGEAGTVGADPQAAVAARPQGADEVAAEAVPAGERR